MRCILSRFVSTTTLMFLLRWYLHILLVKKTPILSLMLIISFTVTKFPQVFLGLSRICLLNAMSMSHYFFCRSQGADFCTLTQAFFLTISQVLGGVWLKSRCRFLHLDLGNAQVIPWDLGFFLPKSGCRNLHVDLGCAIDRGVVEMDSWAFHGFSTYHICVLHIICLLGQKSIISTIFFLYEATGQPIG